MLNRSQAPSFGEIKEFHFLNPEKIVLSNGIQAYLLSAETQDVCRLDFIFEAGSRLQNKLCVANATNSLLSEGTAKHSASELADKLDTLGAFIQSACSLNDAVFTLYCLNKHLEKCLALVCEMIYEASFPENELQVYASSQAQRLETAEKKTSHLSRIAFNRALFGSQHPYGMNARPDDYLQLRREDLTAFHKLHYIPSNTRIICSGKLDPNLASLLEKYPGSIQNKQNVSLLKPTLTIEPSPEKMIFVEKEDSVQSSIRMGRRLFDRTHPDYRPLQMLNMILGGFFGSRLMKNIREEKGLTYGIYSGMESLKEEGAFYIATDVNNELCETAVNEIRLEILRLQEEMVPESELQLAKNYLLGSFLRSLDGPFEQAERIKILIDYDLGYDYYQEYIHIIASIQPTVIQELAQKHLQINDLYTVIAGKKTIN